MVRIWVSVLAMLVGVLTQGCRQAGCTEENCRAMVDACRVEFQGSPSSLVTVTCIGTNRPATPIDFSKYCVEACNANRSGGTLAACLAGGADRCRSGAAAQVIAECTTANTSEGPEASCAARCTTEQTECDTRCSGGRACDTCLRMGGSCGAVCTSTNVQTCLDCGASCGLSWLACVDRCPRATR